MKIKNLDADRYLVALSKVSHKVTGKLGYAVARNMREITESLREYTKIKNELIVKYGDIRGNEAILNTTSSNFQKFQEEIEEIANIEHEISIMLVDVECVYNSTLSADDISGLLFMFNEGVANNG